MKYIKPTVIEGSIAVESKIITQWQKCEATLMSAIIMACLTIPPRFTAVFAELGVFRRTASRRAGSGLYVLKKYLHNTFL